MRSRPGLTLRGVYRQVGSAAGRYDLAEAPARRALLTGVGVSAVLLVVGLLLVLLRHDPRPNEPPSLVQMLRRPAGLGGVSFLYLGLLTLAFTPVLRVMVMTGVYLRRREWFMLVVSLIVLSLLAIGLLLGKG